MLLLVVGVFGLGALLTQVLSERPLDVEGPIPGPTQPVATARPPSSADLPVMWVRTADDLSPGREIIGGVDGAFDGPSVIDGGSTWLVLTDNGEGLGTVLHGLNATTGASVWARDLEGGLCARRLLAGQVACAWVLERDPTSGLGTTWRVELIDPATGESSVRRDLTGWFTLVHVQHDRLMLVEQRQPAPQAVVTILGADLEQLAQVDLQGQGAHDQLFSTDRITRRGEYIPPGPALDRPRVRELGEGLTAFWAGKAAAFLDLRSGALVGLPTCSRPSDDGARLWCNDPDGAIAYDYHLNQLHRTATGIRLAYPSTDRRTSDVAPVGFLDPEGRAIRVDPATGQTLGVLYESTNGEVFGMTTYPTIHTTGGIMLVDDAEHTASVDPTTGQILWEVPRLGVDAAYLLGERLLVMGPDVMVVDPRTGETLGRYRHVGYKVEPVGSEAWVGVGSDEIGRHTLP